MRLLLVLNCVLFIAVNRVAATGTNVLFIVADDLRDHLGCYGNLAVHTPNIDRLADEGVRFDRAYVQYPVCNPSRSSFLTGLRPDRTGITDNTTMLRSKLPDVVTLPQLLREHGYYAASFGKIFHLGGGRDSKARDRWIDLPASWDEAHVFTPTTAGKIIAGRNLTGDSLKWCAWGKTAGDDDDQPDGQNAREAIALMQRLGEKPWFIGVGFHKPHDPFVAPAKYFDLYPAGSIELHRDPASMTAAPPLAVGFGAYAESFGQFTDVERMEFQTAYYAGVSFIDAQVGRLLDALDQLNLRNKTLVIFISDHGYHLGERNWWNKNTLFDRSVRTPMLIAPPGQSAGVAAGIVEFVDLYPTIADYCDVAVPGGLAGTSLRPILLDPAAKGRDAAFTIVTRGPSGRGDSVRTDRWRYTHWSDGTTELYDHENNADEIVNLASDSQYADIVKQHQALLAAPR